MKYVSIRKYIIDNFKGDNESEIEESINDTIKEGLEEALPGLGVFMELIWNNASENLKKELLEILKAQLNYLSLKVAGTVSVTFFIISLNFCITSSSVKVLSSALNVNEYAICFSSSPTLSPV